MTNEQTNVIVFKDGAGECYVLPQATLEQGRVPVEHRAEAERLLAAAEGDDTAGHVVNIGLTPSQAIYIGTFLIVAGDVVNGRSFLDAGFEANRTGQSVGLKPPA